VVTWGRRAATAIAIGTGAVLVAGVVLAGRFGDGDDIGYLTIGAVLGLLSLAMGMLVAYQRPANAVGPLLGWLGLVAVALPTCDVVSSAMARGDIDVSPLWVASQEGAWVWFYIPVALLVLVFPDGRLPSRSWRWRTVAILLVLDGLAIQLGTAWMTPYSEPFDAVEPPLGTVPDAVGTAALVVLMPGLLALLVCCAAAMVSRYRRGTATVRAQVKWLSLAALTVPGTLLACWAGYLLGGEPGVAVLIGIAVIYVLVPLATAVAVLRHDLYDVDRAVSATVTYVLATAALLATFAGSSFLLGLWLGRGSPVLAAAATALLAVVLSPLRTRLQRRVDRWLYPVRQAALAAVDTLRRRVHDGEADPEELEAVLRTALRDPTLRVGYLPPGSDTVVDVSGAAIGSAGPSTVAVELSGQPVGTLASEGRTSKDLLRELGAASVLLIEVVRLRIELAAALRDVESSRARLLHIGYEERRRLGRDLHDGAQQRLVTLGMALRVAQRHLDDGTVDTNGLLDQAVAQLATAVGELRQIAHGLRPGTLDDGLAPALRTLAGSSPIPLQLDVTSEPLPDDVTATVYYVASEAVTNAVKHANARQIDVQVVRQNGDVRVLVTDDGQGGANARVGSGLSGLSDRVAAAGGRLLVDSPPGHGTQIEAVLPCAS